jgi:hypothetical protein
MKIKARHSFITADAVVAPGQVLNVDDALAADWISAGIAAAHTPEPKAATVNVHTEHAIQPRARRHRS